VKIVLLDEAQRRFEAEDGWWRDNRGAEDLFFLELQTYSGNSARPLASDSATAALEAS
jgi:hypothetical protein